MTGRCKNLEIFLPHNQCDQIRRFFVLWAIIQSQWQQLFYPNQPTLLGNFCKGVKVIHFSSEITFGQLLWTFGDFYLVTLLTTIYRSLQHILSLVRASLN